VGARQAAATREEMVGARTATKAVAAWRQASPVSVKELALGLPKHAWRTIGWREGTAEPLSSRFARVRVRVARVISGAASAGRKNGC